MRKRKTVSVEWLKERVNSFNLESADDLSASRLSMSFLLEEVLVESGNYRGLGFIGTKQREASSRPDFSIGINDDLSFEGTDDSRRFYY